MEEERYRVPPPRRRDVLAEEIGKFSLCCALGEHEEAKRKRFRGRKFSRLDVAGIKEGIFRGDIQEGDEVEGEGTLSPYAAVYQPRAYYPAYVMGEVRAALRRGQPPPQTSPHYLPVSQLPPLPDGWRIRFLYPARKEAFDRPDFPAHVRDVLTRDYQRIPFLLPPGSEELRGRVRFRARLLQLGRDAMSRYSGMGENTYDAYAARGILHFLEPLELEEGERDISLRGSLFAEVSFAEDIDRGEIGRRLEELVCGVASEIFPECRRGAREDGGCYLPESGHHVLRFRSRLLALVYDPVIAVYRSPRLLGIYLPGELGDGGGDLRRRWESLAHALLSRLEREFTPHSPVRVEMCHDPRAYWARERGVMSGPDFLGLEEKRPFLAHTLRWLRGT
ncbi:MAG: hypothetical protein H5T73_00005 [Actinobacteria bacterium]|nr:hypothetical protein [Actinomycetota bacterium]